MGDTIHTIHNTVTPPRAADANADARPPGDRAGGRRPTPFWRYTISGATPVVSPCVAVACLFLNFFISGTGTLIVACMPASRGERRNVVIAGLLQFFFVWLFLPWLWSFIWGINLVVHSQPR